MASDFLDALRPVFDCLADGVCMADGVGRLLYANAAAGVLLGPSAAEAVESGICGPLCGGFEGQCEKAKSCPLRIPRGERNEITFKGKFGATGRELRVRCFRVRLPSLERRFLVIEDVTAHAEAGRRREEWRQMLAHDLRSPLTVALGALRAVAEMGVGRRLGVRDLELVEGGVRNCVRIETLIDAYLDTARLEEGLWRVAAEAVGLEELASAVAGELRPAALSRGQILEVDVPPGLSANADRELLRRALANVVGNALKFGPDGGRVRVDAQVRAGEVVLRVADDGPGISPEDLPRVFDRYYQGAGARKRKGLGLGLPFCRAALRAMGGDVEVESKEGRGAIFTLRLSRASAEGGAP